MIRLFRSLLAFSVILLPGLVFGQGLLVNITPGEVVALPRPVIVIHHPPVPIPRPVPPSSYKIKELSVQVKLSDQVAKTQVSQSFVNTGSVQMEVCFVFPLPYDGAIDQLTLLVDGKEFPARLLSAEEARKTYEDIVRKNRDPALLEWIGTGMFKTSVFPVPPGAERTVTLRYSQLCRKDQGLTDFLFPLSTAKYTSHPVEKLHVQVAIDSSAEIKNVYSPTYAVEIKRPDNKHAIVTYTSTNQVPTADFRLLYDVGKGEVGASVLSYRPKSDEEGYFLLLASPEIKAADEERPKKTVVFAVDRSGSMSGEKFQQAKGALKFVLNNLREGDLFNIVAYDSQVESFKPELQRFDEETRKAALGYVEGLYAGGSTNIDGALRSALTQFQDSSRPNYVIFLTDGLPTDGETNEQKIVANAKGHNAVRARIFAFGVGYDVNSRLLDKLVRSNFGQSEYVRPNEDIEARVGSLYGRIASPVMTDLAIKFEFDSVKTEEGPAVSRTYPADAHDLFAGEQLVLVGRYKKSGAAKVVVSGQVGKETRKFDFPAKFVEKSHDDTNAFVEKLWAVRRIGEIIDEIDLKGRNPELVKELVQLSTKHGVLTPYTSFLADERTDRRDLASNATRAFKAAEALGEAAGRSGFGQRQSKGAYQRANQAPAPGISVAADGAIAPGGNVYYDYEKDKNVAVQTVQNVGRKTFYRRGQQWVDGDVTKEQEQKVIKIERFSPAYFDLVAKNGKEVAKYLTIDEPVLVEIDGQAYEFERGFEILYEEGPCLAVLKPAGLLTQAPPGIDSLEVRIKAFLKEREAKPGGVYLGVPHRLDRPVSGAMVFAKHIGAARRLSKQFERREVRKLYWACVAGRVEPAEGTWTDILWKVHGQPRAQVVDASHPGGQTAILHYRTLGEYRWGSWLEIELETGRTHQVRVQAASRDHAILGDAHYGSQIPFGPQSEDERLRAIALHARSLNFRHPMTRTEVYVVAPVSAAWEETGVKV